MKVPPQMGAGFSVFFLCLGRLRGSFGKNVTGRRHLAEHPGDFPFLATSRLGRIATMWLGTTGVGQRP